MNIWTYFVYNYICLYIFIYIYIYSYMKNFLPGYAYCPDPSNPATHTVKNRESKE